MKNFPGALPGGRGREAHGLIVMPGLTFSVLLSFDFSVMHGLTGHLSLRSLWYFVSLAERMLAPPNTTRSASLSAFRPFVMPGLTGHRRSSK
ncbi:MAG: hypothetical protein K6G79_04900 [Bacteroidales bacterium]|nr:hypothetical protein [Bacteroidales bacterium]